MTEKRYFKRRWEVEEYIIDSQQISEKNRLYELIVTNNNLVNQLISELENVKKLMETNDNVNFYLNVRFSSDEMETWDLSKFATIKLCEDGIACYSLQNHSSSFIYFDKIVGLELVESKINERILRS